MSEKAITIWRFEDAPEMYQRLSTNGGDEDWIVVYPEGEDENTMREIDMKVVERLTVCDYDMYTAEDGRRIAITCHA